MKTNPSSNLIAISNALLKIISLELDGISIIFDDDTVMIKTKYNTMTIDRKSIRGIEEFKTSFRIEVNGGSVIIGKDLNHVLTNIYYHY